MGGGTFVLMAGAGLADALRMILLYFVAFVVVFHY